MSEKRRHKYTHQVIYYLLLLVAEVAGEDPLAYTFTKWCSAVTLQSVLFDSAWLFGSY